MPKTGAPTAHQWNVQCLTIQGVEERCKLIPRKLAASLKVIKASIGLLLLKALQKPAGPSRTFSTLGNIPQPETMHTCSPEDHCVLWPLILAHLLDKEEPCLVLNPVVSLSLCSLPAHAHQATTKTYSNDLISRLQTSLRVSLLLSPGGSTWTHLLSQTKHSNTEDAGPLTDFGWLVKSVLPHWVPGDILI